MLSVVSVIPAKKGITGASLALVHILLGVVKKTGGKVGVTVVTSAGALRHPAFRRLRDAGAACHVLDIDRFPSPLYWLLLMLRLFFLGRHDVAHFSTSKTFFLMYPAACLTARAKVLTLEGYAPYELAGESGFRKLIGMMFWQVSLKLADRVAACSSWLQKVVERSHGYGWKVSTVHNPVDFDRFSAKLEKTPDGPLVFVGRLHPVKGVDTALKAVAHLKERKGVFVKLLVVGDGEEMMRLRKMAEDLGVSSQVDFLGYRYDVETFMRKASAVLVPSRYEPFGMTAAEAGAAGKPVVASSTGGLREIVDDGVSGFLFKPEDHVELADRVGKLLEDDLLRSRMGEAAHKKVSEEFSPEAVASKMVRVYLDALRQSARRP
ncbi:MAG: glycosyltransferase family 4 protein [Candidatus Caldarchaeum sp.]|nr:glycosyltransferase family 4 protein [Candidatus Caldarchaeum sp.]